MRIAVRIVRFFLHGQLRNFSHKTAKSRPPLDTHIERQRPPFAQREQHEQLFRQEKHDGTISVVPEALCVEDAEHTQANSSIVKEGEHKELSRIHAKLLTVFTCTMCNTRSQKLMSKHAYTHGVVLVRCPGCDNLHLFADHLGWFEDKSVTIEDICNRHGINFHRGVKEVHD